jgi:hypothetical protein
MFELLDLALLLQDSGPPGDTGDPTATGLFRFFAGFFLIMFLYIGALGFTYWISKDD